MARRKAKNKGYFKRKNAMKKIHNIESFLRTFQRGGPDPEQGHKIPYKLDIWGPTVGSPISLEQWESMEKVVSIICLTLSLAFGRFHLFDVCTLYLLLMRFVGVINFAELLRIIC